MLGFIGLPTAKIGMRCFPSPAVELQPVGSHILRGSELVVQSFLCFELVAFQFGDCFHPVC